MSDALSWVRAPQQARSHATLARLLDATEALLDREPFDDLTVQAICKEGQSSVGAFYARFPDKTGLLHVLHERLCGKAKATAELALDPRRWHGTPLADVLAQMVRFMVREYGTRSGLRKELVRRNGTDPSFQARSIDVAAFTVARLGALLAERRAELAHQDPAMAAEFCHRLLFGVLDQHAAFLSSGPAGVHVDDEDLTRELIRALVAYLGVRAEHSAHAT